MLQTLIQTLLHHHRNRKPAHLERSDIDSTHGGHRDRSGLIVILFLLISLIIALALS